MEPLFSVPQTAAQLTVSPASVWRYLALEQLERIKISSRCTRIPERSIQAFLQTRSTPTYREASPVFETLMNFFGGGNSSTDEPAETVDNSLDGTPIAGMNCTQCGAPVVRTKTITAEDGSTGVMPGNGYWATPSCDCLADCTAPGGGCAEGDKAGASTGKGGLEDPADEV